MFIEGLTVDEIKILRDMPTSGYAHTDDAITAQGILAVGRMYANNPNVDQGVLVARNIEALAGPDAAKALVIQNVDQTVTAESTRMQQQEVTVIKSLNMPVPVSPRDNHLIHGQVCMQMLMAAGQAISQLDTDDMVLQQTQHLVNHFAEHLSMYLASGNPAQNPQFREMNDFYKRFKVQFVQAVQIREQARAITNTAAMGGSPEAVKAIADAPMQPVQGEGKGVMAPPQSAEAGVKQGGPDVQSIQAALAQEQGKFAPNEIKDQQKRAYYRPPGVEWTRNTTLMMG